MRVPWTLLYILVSTIFLYVGDAGDGVSWSDALWIYAAGIVAGAGITWAARS